MTKAPAVPLSLHASAVDEKRASLLTVKLSSDSETRPPRNRLVQWQIDVLEQKYLRGSQWSTAEMKELAEKLGISRTKVYKWSWDRKRKEIELDLVR